MIDDWEAHFKRIYRTEPAKYNRLVATEDAYGELAQHVDALAVARRFSPLQPTCDLVAAVRTRNLRHRPSP